MSRLTYRSLPEPEAKPLVWLGGEVVSPPFSLEARREAGALLRQLQQGTLLGLPHARPMPIIGARCHELRVTDRACIWRIVRLLEPDAVVILDVFQKSTRTTPRTVIDRCKRRLALYMQTINNQEQ